MTTDLIHHTLLLSTLDHVKADPKSWHQQSWRCGTTACFAGHAALLNGAQWALEPGHHTAFMPEGAIRLDADGDTDRQASCMYSDDVTWVDDEGQRYYQHVSAYARGALGLTQQDAEALFAASNSMARLEEIIDDLTPLPVQPSM